jgi:hypothetical protein
MFVDRAMCQILVQEGVGNVKVKGIPLTKRRVGGQTIVETYK